MDRTNRTDYIDLTSILKGVEKTMFGEHLINVVQSFPNNPLRYPPLDLIKISDNHYRINIALAGYNKGDITITEDPQQNQIVITSGKVDNKEYEYIEEGISKKRFERIVPIPQHAKIDSAIMENGLLSIDIKNNIPEDLKPRNVDIK